MSKLLTGAVLVALLCLTAGSPIAAQGFFDDFESYDPGLCDQSLIGQGGWAGWCDCLCPGYLSCSMAASGTNSLQIGLDTDIIQTFDPPLVGGGWRASAQVHIPSTMTGQVWFILLNQYDCDPMNGVNNWSTQVSFQVNGDDPSQLICEVINGGGGAITGSGVDVECRQGVVSTTDAWHELRIDIQLDSGPLQPCSGGGADYLPGRQQIYLDDVLVSEGTWQNCGLSQIRALDIWSVDADEAYFDDISVQPLACGPIGAFQADWAGGTSEVTLTWENGAAYDGLTLHRNGTEIATLPGDATSYEDVVPGGGTYTYELTATCAGETVRSCVGVGVFLPPPGATDLVWAPLRGEDILGSSAPIAAALESLGRVPFVCSVLPTDVAELANFETIWCSSGHSSGDHVITETEGQLLRDYLELGIPGAPRGLYVEGGDVLENPSTVLNEVLGATNPDGGAGLSCDVSEVTGTASGVAGGPDLAGLDLHYDFVDCRSVDRFELAPSFPLGSVGPVLGVPVGAGDPPLYTAVYHNGFDSGFGSYRTLVASTKIAGFGTGAANLVGAYLAALLPPGAYEQVRRGDCDGNGEVNGFLDGIFLLSFAFTTGSPEPPCFANCDTNGDGAFTGVVDGLYLLNYQFLGGTPPAAPFPNCGPAPASVNALGCDDFTSSCP